MTTKTTWQLVSDMIGIGRPEKVVEGEQTKFTTQAEVDTSAIAAIISPQDLASGAPFAPLPRSFHAVPDKMGVCQDLATKTEIDEMSQLRRHFNVGEYQAPYVADVARAFRLLKGKKVYVEIGTFDRGNLAFVSQLLADDALLIGVDTVEDVKRDEMLKARLKPRQRYCSVTGNSRDPNVVQQVQDILGSREIDSIFIDGDHTAYGVLSDYANYEMMVSEKGVFLFHDSVWEGNDQYKGVADALAEVDKLDNVWIVDGNNPVRRFLRPMWKVPLWGVVGVVFAADQHWRRLPGVSTR